MNYLQVLPVELDAPGAHPQEEHAGQQEVGERPAQTRHHDLKQNWEIELLTCGTASWL